MSRFLAVLAVVMSLHLSHSFRILGLFPHAGESHYQIFQPIMKALAEAGHEVTVLSHFPERSNITGLRVLVIDEHKSLMNAMDLAVNELWHRLSHYFFTVDLEDE